VGINASDKDLPVCYSGLSEAKTTVCHLHHIVGDWPWRPCKGHFLYLNHYQATSFLLLYTLLRLKRGRREALWFQMGKIRQKSVHLMWFHEFVKAVVSWFTSFRFRMAELHIQNLSNRCRHKHDLSISRIMKIYFWRVFTISSSCVAQSSSRNSAVCYIQLFHRRYACVREL
jgi:hypothetical protein